MKRKNSLIKSIAKDLAKDACKELAKTIYKKSFNILSSKYIIKTCVAGCRLSRYIIWCINYTKNSLEKSGFIYDREYQSIDNILNGIYVCVYNKSYIIFNITNEVITNTTGIPRLVNVNYIL